MEYMHSGILKLSSFGYLSCWIKPNLQLLKENNNSYLNFKLREVKSFEIK